MEEQTMNYLAAEIADCVHDRINFVIEQQATERRVDRMVTLAAGYRAKFSNDEIYSRQLAINCLADLEAIEAVVGVPKS